MNINTSVCIRTNTDYINTLAYSSNTESGLEKNGGRSTSGGAKKTDTTHRLGGIFNKIFILFLTISFLCSILTPSL